MWIRPGNRDRADQHNKSRCKINGFLRRTHDLPWEEAVDLEARQPCGSVDGLTPEGAGTTGKAKND
jgi:hypothetical protein